MPRPGPRPYECVRRAWHSERHKPLRGSVIQQIFRLVGEAHGEKTKNNREWKEKLPVVVLKCEEILYSKANSEAEYLSQETLWDRVSDAVNTIIRLEEVDINGTGKLLPPCVEAALTLGCVPMKSSRSQRHCNTRTYLTPRAQDPNVPVPQRTNDNVASQQCLRLAPTSLRSPNGDRNLVQKAAQDGLNPFSVLNKSVHSGEAAQSVPMEPSSTLNFGSVYPLYYGPNYQLREQGTQVRVSHLKRIHDESQEILVGRPVSRLIPEPASVGALKILLPEKTSRSAVKTATQPFPHDHHEATGSACDVSLQLGLPPVFDKEKNIINDYNALSNFQVGGSNLSELGVWKGKELFSAATNDAIVTLDLCSNRWYSEGVSPVAESSVRNSQGSFYNFMEDGQFCWQPEPPSNQFGGRSKWPGL